MEIDKIKNELKEFKSNRKATLKLLSLVSGTRICMGNYMIYCGAFIVLQNQKNINFGLRCRICRWSYAMFEVKMSVGSNKVEFYVCSDCKNKTLCFGCLRETSRCSLIHTRKLLCWQFLLSHKFPKDIIRLITKKVK